MFRWFVQAFDTGAQEKRYKNELFENHLSLMKVSLVLGIVLMLSFSVFDLMVEDGGQSATRYRFMLHAPIISSIGLSFFLWGNASNWQLYIASLAITAHLAAMHIMVIYGPESSFGISSGAAALNTVAIIMYILALFPLNAFAGAAITITIFSVYIYTYLWFANYNRLDFISNATNIFVVAFTGNLVCIWRERLLRQSHANQVRLDNERIRAEGILYQLVPERVVQRLKRGESPISEAHAEVCVTFADIVDFSNLSLATPPQLLVESLNALFERFVKEALDCGVEHFKSIGDSFMAVEVRDRFKSSDTKNSLDLALAMNRIAKEVSDHFGIDLRLRVGSHIGFAVGGVMEAISPFYDFWGTTVNIASRLEETGEVNRVQVSEAVRSRYGPFFNFEKRVEIDLKGHGSFLTYWLMGRKTGTDQPAMEPGKVTFM